CTGVRAVRWSFSKPNRCIAIEAAEGTRDARRIREGAVEEWQSLNLAAIHHEGRFNGINPAKREFLTHRFQANLAHLVGQPVPGYLIYCRPRAVESLLFIGANNSSNASLHIPTPIRLSGRRGRSGRNQSTLMLAARTTLAHFSVSSRISLPKSAGEPGSTIPPRSANRVFTWGSPRAALISILSFSMIAGDVSLGATSPTHWLASKPGMNSLSVGMSGSASERVAVVTANARSLPVLMCPSEVAISVNATWICPPSRSVTAGAAPR